MRNGLKGFCLVYFSLFSITVLANINEPSPFYQRAEVQAFMDEMAEKHQFSKQQLNSWFSQIKEQKRVLELIATPWEAKPWYQYHPIFVTDDRAKQGWVFWQAYDKVLAKASEVYGVPVEIILAILGVETYYGKHKGKFPVLDSVATLAFSYPKRAKFFRSELEQLLLLIKEERMNPNTLYGSYAGAMGQSQFIASSYRAYAVDFDQDGHRNLFTNVEDAVGSVANYFKQHKWQKNGPIAVKIKTTKQDISKLLSTRLTSPKTQLSVFLAQGIKLENSYPEDEKSFVFELEQDEGKKEHWIAFQNFYVITRYNRSIHYAMAVYQLAEKIKRLHDQAKLTL